MLLFKIVLFVGGIFCIVGLVTLTVFCLIELIDIIRDWGGWY